MLRNSAREIFAVRTMSTALKSNPNSSNKALYQVNSLIKDPVASHACVVSIFTDRQGTILDYLVHSLITSSPGHFDYQTKKFITHEKLANESYDKNKEFFLSPVLEPFLATPVK